MTAESARITVKAIITIMTELQLAYSTVLLIKSSSRGQRKHSKRSLVHVATCTYRHYRLTHLAEVGPIMGLSKPGAQSYSAKLYSRPRRVTVESLTIRTSCSTGDYGFWQTICHAFILYAHIGNAPQCG